MRTHQRKLLPERVGGVFELSGLYPLPQFSLAKGGEISVVVALPAAAEALDWAPAAEPQMLGGRAVPPGVPAIASSGQLPLPEPDPPPVLRPAPECGIRLVPLTAAVVEVGEPGQHMRE